MNVKTRREETALFLAAWRGHKEVAQLLLEEGVDIGVKNIIYL